MYYALVFANAGPYAVRLRYTIRAYLPDGTPGPSCFGGWNGDEDGLPEVPAGGRSLAVCWPRAAGVLGDSLRLVGRAELVGGVHRPADANLQMTDVRVIPVPTYGWKSYTADGMLAVPPGRDRQVIVHFRMLDSAGEEVASCNSEDVIVQPEVPQRVGCMSTGVPRLRSGQPQPVSATAEVYRSELLWWP
jgi:hypothetical protein